MIMKYMYIHLKKKKNNNKGTMIKVDASLTSSDPVFLVGWGRVFGVMKYKVTILNSVTACPALWIRNS